MLFEDEMNTRSNVDSINSMYEVSPFSSFGELIDLEDFLISHSKLEKYRKTQKSGQINRVEDQIYFSKIDEIRKNLNIFTRFFNIACYTPNSEYDAQKLMCVLMPEVSELEEVFLILNPIYSDYTEDAVKLLDRMKYKIV